MPAHVFALFDSDADLASAQKSLEQAGHGEQVVRVIDGGTPQAMEPAIPLVPGALLPTSAAGQPHAPAVAPFAFDGFGGYGLDDEESQYLQGAVSGGASLLILETDASEVQVILNEAGAQRVFSKG